MTQDSWASFADYWNKEIKEWTDALAQGKRPSLGLPTVKLGLFSIEPGAKIDFPRGTGRYGSKALQMDLLGLVVAGEQPVISGGKLGGGRSLEKEGYVPHPYFSADDINSFIYVKQKPAITVERGAYLNGLKQLLGWLTQWGYIDPTYTDPAGSQQDKILRAAVEYLDALPPNAALGKEIPSPWTLGEGRTDPQLAPAPQDTWHLANVGSGWPNRAGDVTIGWGGDSSARGSSRPASLGYHRPKAGDPG